MVQGSGFRVHGSCFMVCGVCSSPMSNKSAAPFRELVEKTTFKSWRKGSFTWQKLTESSEKPQHAYWNQAMRTVSAVNAKDCTEDAESLKPKASMPETYSQKPAKAESLKPKLTIL
eukprot:1264201-Rhodomonas_salina.4